MSSQDCSVTSETIGDLKRFNLRKDQYHLWLMDSVLNRWELVSGLRPSGDGGKESHAALRSQFKLESAVPDIVLAGKIPQRHSGLSDKEADPKG